MRVPPQFTVLAGMAIAWSATALLSFPAMAASLDCAKAAAPVERLICSDENLSALDSELSRAYRPRLGALPDQDAAALRRDQRQWLGRRTRDCGSPSKIDDQTSPARPAIDCLTEMYRQRIGQLNGGSTSVSTGKGTLTGKKGDFLTVLVSNDDRVCGPIFSILDREVPKRRHWERVSDGEPFIKWNTVKIAAWKNSIDGDGLDVATADIDNDGDEEFLVRRKINILTGYSDAYNDFVDIFKQDDAEWVVSGGIDDRSPAGLKKRVFLSFFGQQENIIPILDKPGPLSITVDGIRRPYLNEGFVEPFLFQRVTYILFYMSNTKSYQMQNAMFNQKDVRYLWGGVVRIRPDRRADDMCYFEPIKWK